MPLLDGVKCALVVAAHPDDEVLGCGGTVARLAEGGVKVATLILSTGALSREGSDRDEVDRLRASAKKAAATLKVYDVRFASFPDNAMDSVPLLSVIQTIERAVKDLEPDLVFTHAAIDLNIDHRVVRSAVLAACRPLPGHSVRTILAFETVSSSDWADPAMGAFNPTVHVDISAYLERKIEALRHYDAEMRPSPHSRSLDQIHDLARVRGRTVGVAAVESFELIRSIEK